MAASAGIGGAPGRAARRPRLERHRELVTRREMAGNGPRAAGAAGRLQTARGGGPRRVASGSAATRAGWPTRGSGTPPVGEPATSSPGRGAGGPGGAGGAARVHLLEHAAQAAAAVSPWSSTMRRPAARPVLGGCSPPSRSSTPPASARRRRPTAAPRRAGRRRAEQRAEEERGRLADARRAATAAGDEYAAPLESWQADPQAIALRPARRADGRDRPRGRRVSPAPPPRRPAGRAPGGGGGRPPSGGRSGSTVRAVRRREQVAAERDPAPSAPAVAAAMSAIPLTARRSGSSSTSPTRWTRDDRAGVEAALEASGLLDAWVRADGAVLEADGATSSCRRRRRRRAGSRLDDRAAADPPTVGPSTPRWSGACSRASPWRAPTRRARPGCRRTPTAAWRPRAPHGPLHEAGRPVRRRHRPCRRTRTAPGRAGRPIDALDRDPGRRAACRDRGAGRRRAAIEAWLTAVPSTSALLTAWTRLDERERVTARPTGARPRPRRSPCTPGSRRQGGAATWPSWPRPTTCPRTPSASPPAASACAASTTRCPGTPTPPRRCARRCCGGPTTPSGRRPRRTRPGGGGDGDRRPGAGRHCPGRGGRARGHGRGVAAGDPAAHRSRRAAGTASSNGGSASSPRGSARC